MNTFFQLFIKGINLDNPISEIFLGIEKLCELFNEFFLIFFTYIKYIFAFVLIIIGLMTILRYRGIYSIEKLKQQSKLVGNESWKEKLKQTHVFLGMIYLLMGFGIIFNYITYILIWSFDPLPDRFIFRFINFIQFFYCF